MHGASFGRSRARARPIGREGHGGLGERFCPVGGPHAVSMRDRSVPGGLWGGPRQLDGPEGQSISPLTLRRAHFGVKLITLNSVR